MWTAEALALVAAAFGLGGFVKGALGLGLPPVVLAVLAGPLGLPQTLAVLLVPAMASNVWQALSGPAFRPLLARLWPFFLASVPGIWIGVGVLAGAGSGLLEIVLGVLLILYSLLALSRFRPAPPGRHEGWSGPVASFLGGIMFGMAGVFIVPGILWLESLRLDRDRFVQALGMTFLTISSTLALSMGGRGLLDFQTLAVSAAAFAPTVGGLWLGRRLRHRLPEHIFRRLFFLGLIASGLHGIWRQMG